MEATKQEKIQQPECPGAKPQAEHEWLQKLVGEWDAEGEAMMGPDQPANKWKAREVVRSIGGMWVVGEGTGDMPEGGTATTIITLGFDPRKGRYVGSFIASMMANMWIYEGSLEGNVLTLDCEGPAMGPQGGTAKYQDIIELKSNDLRTLTSRMQDSDGHWMQVMIATYRRIK